MECFFHCYVCGAELCFYQFGQYGDYRISHSHHYGRYAFWSCGRVGNWIDRQFFETDIDLWHDANNHTVDIAGGCERLYGGCLCKTKGIPYEAKASFVHYITQRICGNYIEYGCDVY